MPAERHLQRRQRPGAREPLDRDDLVTLGLRPEDDPESLARLYLATPGKPGGPSSGMTFSEAMDRGAHRKPDFLSGGGGLVSTAGDYLRFVEMLRRG